jgi:general stress protein 26
MHSKSTSIRFIQDKVNNIGSALFYSRQDSVLKFPTTIINVLTVDELGQIWFHLTRPTQYLHAFDSQFNAELDFYRKGKGYYLKIYGKAFVVNDPEEISGLIQWSDKINRAAMEKMILLKLKIQRVDYFAGVESDNKKSLWWNAARNWFINLLLPGAHRPSPQYILL